MRVKLETPLIKKINNTQYIFCIIRKKWIILTPEENVRQFFLHHLINEHGYFKKYISVEKKITVNEQTKRYDIVVFNQKLQPAILIECKASHVELTQQVMQQITHYNAKLNVPFLVITNGNNTYNFQIRNHQCNSIPTLPKFTEL